MRKTVVTMWICVVGMVLGASVTGWAAPMGTATTYQGRLMDGDSPADGEYDFEFKLYDEPNLAGVQQGSTINIEDQQVSDGLFTVGLDFGSYLNGAVLTETIFGWDGIGRFAMEGIIKRDYPVVMGTIIVGTVAFVLINLLVDLTYQYLDPRVRLHTRRMR